MIRDLIKFSFIKPRIITIFSTKKISVNEYEKGLWIPRKSEITTGAILDQLINAELEKRQKHYQERLQKGRQ